MTLSLLCLWQQAAFNPEVSEEVKKRALMFGSECTTGYIDLLEHVLLVGPKCSMLVLLRSDSSFFPSVVEAIHRSIDLYLGTPHPTPLTLTCRHLSSLQVLQKPTAELKQQLAACSKRVAGAVTELIQTAEAMKGSASLPHTHTPTPLTGHNEPAHLFIIYYASGRLVSNSCNKSFPDTKPNAR